MQQAAESFVSLRALRGSSFFLAAKDTKVRGGKTADRKPPL
jgi:hypothetical protein